MLGAKEAPPAESEHPEAEISGRILLYSKQQSLRTEPFQTNAKKLPLKS